MIEKKTVVDQIEITRNGTVQIRLGLLLIEDGREIGCSWHRTAIQPGGDVDAQIAAVNADITTRPTLRAQPINPDDIPRIKQFCDLAHTPEVVSAFRSRQAEVTE